ncbi:hypothetical protein [Kitasatospora brasiliensis]|uniref:hypothetical protein n=1 Tax=Kitasatospora brasiliensis TaxID=3058040 RepID=UPI002931E0D7|nr:hypothetical protein [Kitasatospora sp. K002]
MQCPAGTTITGGGVNSNGIEAGDSYPSGNNTWTATVSTISGLGDITVYAVCLPLAT